MLDFDIREWNMPPSANSHVPDKCRHNADTTQTPYSSTKNRVLGLYHPWQEQDKDKTRTGRLNNRCIWIEMRDQGEARGEKGAGTAWNGQYQ